MPEKMKAAPPGAYVQVGVDEIDDGKFKALLNSVISKAYRDFLDYEKATGDSKAKAVITPKITITRMKNSEELVEIAYTCPHKAPTVTRATTAKSKGDKLLCQPSGTNTGNPDQQLFFDSRGAPIGVDADTGEETKEHVAGRIGQAVAQG